jgi:hypothetical protein
MVNLPTGGKKKRLNSRVANKDARAASRNPHALATIKTSNRYANPTVVGLTGTTLYAANVTIPTPLKAIKTRTGRHLSMGKTSPTL